MSKVSVGRKTVGVNIYMLSVLGQYIADNIRCRCGSLTVDPQGGRTLCGRYYE